VWGFGQFGGSQWLCIGDGVCNWCDNNEERTSSYICRTKSQSWRYGVWSLGFNRRSFFDLLIGEFL
jgi:hypothetical protein